MGLFSSKSSKLEDNDAFFNSTASARRRMRGRSPETDLNLSKYSFVHWKISKDYLKCDIKPLRNLKRNGAPCPRDLDKDMDRISFDYLPTKFFDMDCPYHERKMRFRMNGMTYKRVVGYREIFMKREYLEYLKDLMDVEGEEIAQGGGITKEKKTTAAPYDPYSALAAKAHAHAATTHAAPTKKKSKVKSKPIPKKKESVSKKKKATPKKKDTGPSCFSKFCKWIGNLGSGSGDRPPTKEELRAKVRKNAEEILKHQAIKKWKWPNKRKRYPVPVTNPPGKYAVLLHRLYRLPKENQERDNEWLYLSSTSEDEDNKTIEHFNKGLHNWMTHGISFESQKLSKNLGLWWFLMGISGRNFLYKRFNFYRGHIEYSCAKGHMIPFIITSLLLWSILCTSLISCFDILFERTIHEDNIFLKVERVELEKYWIPYTALVVVNLTLVAVWSLAVILGDGTLIAHYLNCWCAALHEMETSGTLDITKVTFKNIQIFILYALVYTAMFLVNWPGLVRGSCLLTSMLLFRPMIPLLRLNQPRSLIAYQFIGLGIQLFILFCARLIMCTLQIFALMLKNVSEMWNFKFALRFKLLAKESKGQFYQLELNHSLVKLWSHHKLIGILMEEYGVVFCIGIVLYIVPQVGIFALVMARIILSNEEKDVREEFYGNTTRIEIYSDEEPTIYIPYYHPAIDEIFMAAIIFIHIAIDFFFTTETLVAATDAFTTGGEFARRAGVMTSSKSHERRLIFSLQWSFSPTRLHALTCNRFFTLDRQSLLQFFYFIILIFTIIIRLHKPDLPIKVVFPPKGSCNEKLGQILVHGICTIKTEPETTKPPILPPADYYFFMEHCSEIEQKYLNHTASFEYFTVTDNSSGVTLTANKLPFLICKVNIDDGTPLPTELENFGRYFQDHGSPQLIEILEIIFSKTNDPQNVDYLNITASVSNSHSDTTGGGYCGPDVGGQEGKLCEWVEYYRDCVIVCASKVLNQNLLLQKMWRKTSNGFVLYTDYSTTDCGVNPFGFHWKGDNISIVEPAYDCFGRVINLNEMDLCGNIPIKEPTEPYKPIKGDKEKIYRSYESDWRDVTSKTFTVSTPASLQPCDHCYDYYPANDRCSSSTLVENHCPYSRYWGEHPPQKGYYLAQQCFQWDIDPLDQPKPTGFCNWNYVEGGIIAGHVINQTTYQDARRLQWDREWDLKTGEKAPCTQPVFQGLRQIVHQLYFLHSCLFPVTINSTGSCEPAEDFHFEAYRPYEIVNCKLRQIKLDYEVLGGNDQICDLSNRTMIVPDISNPISLTLKGGRSQSYSKFLGCRGNQLVTSGHGYICTTPEIGGVCEVDSQQGHFGYWNCFDPKILRAPNGNIGLPDDAIFGLCTAAYDSNAPEFKDYRKKLVEPELLTMLKHVKGWNSGDPWRTKLVVYSKSPNISGPVCDNRFKEIYCGSNSFPLHYPFDGIVSKGRDKFECNWEAYWRDCLHPYQSKVGALQVENSTANWVYLPKWVERSTYLQPAKQRRNYPVLNVFAGITGMVGCDGRNLPDDNYWRDDCGWVMTPEFTDGDPKGIAVMPPILAIGHKVYSEEGDILRELVLNCFDTEIALYRCMEPNIFPLCPHTLSNWEPSRDIIENNCFRFNTSCYLDFNKQPNGISLVRPNDTYPEGFCRGYCAQEDLKTSGDILAETFIDKWRTLHTLSFPEPPCLNFSVAPSLFLDPLNPRPIELHLFFEFHCSDKSKNGVIRDFLTSPTSGSFHLPLYKEESTGHYKFVPLQPLLDHLTQKYGESCDYGGRQNEESIYPEYVVFNDTQVQVNISRVNFLGCNGMPLVWLQGYINKYPQDAKPLGLINVVEDHENVCFGNLMGGWCEVDIRPFYFLRDDFKSNCEGSRSTVLPNPDCPDECKKMQAQFFWKSRETEEIPGEDEYYPFVKSKRGILIGKNYSSWSPNSGGVLADPPRTDIPHRRLTSDEFQEVKRKWSLFQDHTKHVQYIQEFQQLIQGPDHLHCHHKDPAMFKKYCIWPYYVQQCYVPCKLIYPEKVITNVSQSLVKRHKGEGNIYLMPLAFVQVGGAIEPAFSFGDCAIDPSQYARQGIMGCNLEQITDHDYFKWGNFPEFFPDPANAILDGPSGFTWIPWVIGYPSKAPFTYFLYTDYVNPRITYSPTVSSHLISTINQQVYISPYLQCHRIIREDIRIQILTGILTYWNSSVLPRVQMLSSHFSYFPMSSSPMDQTCQETYVHVYLYWEACRFWNVPSKVIRIYGFCRAIFPAAVIHGSYGAISENVTYTTPPGCINRKSHLQVFDSTYNSTSGFGLKYSVVDVYNTWNSLCHSCAYTREMHAANLKKTWCGWKKDENPTCLSPMESFNKGRQPIDIGHGIFNHWQSEVQNVGLLWKFAVEYSCWSDPLNRWQFFTRWESYHPWSLKLEGSNVAAYPIHIAMNALACPHPCKGPDESEDCNSECPHHLHNPCDVRPWEGNFFHSGQSAGVDSGLDYTVTLKDDGKLCTSRLAGLNEKPQGLGIFGSYGVNFIQCENQTCLGDREGTNTFWGTSEAVLLDDQWIPSRSGNKKNIVVYSEIIDSTVGVRGPEQAVVTDGGEAPRMMVVHPGYYFNYTGEMYSTFCAALPGDHCELVEIKFNDKKTPAGWQSMEQFLFCNASLPVHGYLDSLTSSDCKTADQQIFQSLVTTDPTKSWDTGAYCCIPYQSERQQCRPGSPTNETALDWAEKYWATVRDTWKNCEDVLDPQTGKSVFGFPFTWGSSARYLKGCSFSDCLTNRCTQKLRDYKATTDTDFCSRQFDPDENFKRVPLQPCNLRLPPF